MPPRWENPNSREGEQDSDITKLSWEELADLAAEDPDGDGAATKELNRRGTELLRKGRKPGEKITQDGYIKTEPDNTGEEFKPGTRIDASDVVSSRKYERRRHIVPREDR